MFLVGNKVDLIPSDSRKYLQRIEDGLIKAAKETGLAPAKVVHTSVISATTGFGVEELITKINSLWGPKGKSISFSSCRTFKEGLDWKIFITIHRGCIYHGLH